MEYAPHVLCYFIFINTANVLDYGFDKDMLADAKLTRNTFINLYLFIHQAKMQHIS